MILTVHGTLYGTIQMFHTGSMRDAEQGTYRGGSSTLDVGCYARGRGSLDASLMYRVLTN